MKYQLLAICGILGLLACAQNSEPPVIKAPTNGGLIGYKVMKGSQLICTDPLVWNQFRGSESVIVCQADEDRDPSFPPLKVTLPDYGVLKGYNVQDSKGNEVCKDPLVSRDAKTNQPTINCP